MFSTVVKKVYKRSFVTGGHHGCRDKADSGCDQRRAQRLSIPVPDAVSPARPHLLPARERLRQCPSTATSSASNNFPNIGVRYKGNDFCLKLYVEWVCCLRKILFNTCCVYIYTSLYT